MFSVYKMLAASAAAVTVATMLWTSTDTHRAPELGAILDQLVAAEGVELSFASGRRTGDLYIADGKIRYDVDGEKGDKTRLWAGDALFDIAWSENRVSVSRPAEGRPAAMELVQVLGLPLDAAAWKQVRAQRPKRVDVDGRKRYVYTCRCPAPGGAITVRATVDPGTQFLESLEILESEPTTIDPIARVVVEKTDALFDEDLFLVGDTLTEDGRIGKILDAQGIVTIRPRIATSDPMRPGRNTPIRPGMIIMPCDVVTTSARGANALKLRLAGGTLLTIGPNATVLLESPSRIQVLHGELQVEADRAHPLTVATNNGQTQQVIDDTAILRVGKPTGLDHTTVERLESKPQWLAGFEGTSNNESIGSLVAHVDGRDVPLTVGYHKVTVDIRDQIARTTIEESFVNHTNGQLEGVFYFPLPQDASISGFGMWIGDQLVEADIVEKQRAREIYETILREKRDPGLLEWTGGNLFKARVFPIFAHSEKRIKITYTQVLPLDGGRYRYSYGLQSDMLKQHPLRQLHLDVTVRSAVPLESVTSPTHPMIVEEADRSATLSFEAQEYTPQRDFEVVIEPAVEGQPVVLVPHRRGEDGYFLLQLTPPGDSQAWSREVINPAGTPMRLMLLCDTSGSMDQASRKLQLQFAETLLRCLGPDDRFDVAMVDTDCTWIEPTEGDDRETQIGDILATLEDRASLGWTDLDKALDSALVRANDVRIAGLPREVDANAQIIYLGDGVQNTYNADPSAASGRLRKAYEDRIRAGAPIRPTCHAVALGSSYEPVVLRAIASLGGGSMRQLSADQGPAKAAAQLLQEITSPGLKDIGVSFEGIRTARVYPDPLPNLAAGKQQIMLGRYLPEGEDQVGKVVVTGTHRGEPVRFAADLTLADAEDGNSFIPRLWARLYLDELLQHGSSQAIKDEIIALSEEYNIITPYTSLLVLESDEDRERFGVTKRFRMRDGERFFAQGRDDADYELLQKYMKEAGAWRIGMRRAVLAQLAGMGRTDYQPARQFIDSLTRYGDDRGRKRDVSMFLGRVAATDGADLRGGDMSWAYDGRMSGIAGAESMSGAMPMSGFGGYGGGGSDADLYFAANGPGFDASEYSARSRDGRMDFAKKAESAIRDEMPALEQAFGSFAESEGNLAIDSDFLAADRAAPMDPAATPMLMPMAFEPMASRPPARMSSFRRQNGARSTDARRSLETLGRGTIDGAGFYMFALSDFKGRQALGERGKISPPYWVESLFPGLADPPVSSQVESEWHREAKDLSDSLLRFDDFLAAEGGWRITQTTESFDLRWENLISRSRTVTLISDDQWLVQSGSDGGQTSVQWCDEDERGVIALGHMLGRVRESEPGDLERPPLSLPAFMTTSVEKTHHHFTPSIRRVQDGLIVLSLVNKGNEEDRRRVTIDPRRGVVTKVEYLSAGDVTSRQEMREFVEVGGFHFPTLVLSYDAEGRQASRTLLEFKRIGAAALNTAIDAALAPRGEIVFLERPGPTLSEAKQAKADGTATFQDRFLLLAHFAATSQLDRVREEWDAARRAAGDRPGVWWLENLILQNTRGHETLKQRLLARIDRLLETEDPKTIGDDQFFRLEQLRNNAASCFAVDENLDLLSRLRPFYDAQPDHTSAGLNWWTARVNCLRSAGQNAAWLEEARELSAAFPHDSNAQQIYVRALIERGDLTKARRVIEAACTPERKWHDWERNNIRESYLSAMETKRRYAELIPTLDAWYAEDPPTNSHTWNRYLTALILGGEERRAWSLIERWLQEACVAGEVSGVAAARFDAAVQHALGSGYNMYRNKVDEQFVPPLADAVLFLARHETESHRASRIMGNWRFRQTDAYGAVRRRITRWLRNEANALPAAKLSLYIGWADLTGGLRRELIDTVRPRWESAKTAEEKTGLEQVLHTLYAGSDDSEEHLAFYRTLWRSAPEDARDRRAQQLFDALIARPWSEAIEDEAYAMIAELMTHQPDDADATQATIAQVIALQRADTWLAQQYMTILNAKIESPEDLTRTELAAKQRENRHEAIARVVARLDQQLRRLPSDLHPWIDMEHVYFAAMLPEANIAALADICWERLGREPRKLDLDDPSQFVLDSSLAHRALSSLMSLACRRSAEEALADDVLRYIDRATELSGGAMAWKRLAYQMLVALDRPDALENKLRTWSETADRPNPWRAPLAYLLAEQGELREAVALLEAVLADDQLGPTDYRALSNWYLALEQRGQYEESRIELYKMMEEWALRNYLQQRFEPYTRHDGEAPPDFDPELLLGLEALMQKAADPDRHIGNLREFYTATREFRLLYPLADAVIGHTAQSVYNTLSGISSLTEQIQDEAAVDELVAHIAEVRETVTLASDLRALDLLEALVERRAAELINQSGPHGDRAVEAMQRAFRREWAAHEPRRMATLLYNMNGIAYDPLKAEQLREFEVLHGMAAPGTIDRLEIAKDWTRSLYHWYDERERAIELLEAALGEFRDAHDGRITPEADSAFYRYVDFLSGVQQFARAEAVLLEQLGDEVGREREYRLVSKLFDIYRNAFTQSGRVSFGSSETKEARTAFFLELIERFDEALDTDDANLQRELADRLFEVYRAAKRFELDYRSPLESFVFERLPEIMPLQADNMHYQYSNAAYAVRDLLGVEAALELLIIAIETEPEWMRRSGDHRGGWNRHNSRLAQYRHEARDSLDPALEERLLSLTLDALVRDLERRDNQGRSLFSDDHGYFWSEKAELFATTADEVFEAHKKSEASILHIAAYLWHDLDRHDRAIAMLYDGLQRKVLGEAGKSRLASYLYNRQRFEESIPVLEDLIAMRPDNIDYRARLMRSFYGAKQTDNLIATLDAADTHFHEKGLWDFGVIATLAFACEETKLYERGVNYFDELISRHQRSRPDRGIGDSTLCEYYRRLALCHSGLGQTALAVDAACGAIISWGSHIDQRRAAVQGLERVLRESPDLPAYIAELDAQVAESGLENPIVRRALGEVLEDRGEHKAAIEQLKIAAEVQPNDPEIYATMLACYDAIGDADGAIQTLLEATRVARRQLDLYKQLGRRFEKQEAIAQAERAYTSIVEALPNETEGHTMLAEIRQGQDRWDDAIRHWEQVAKLRALEPTGLLKLAEALLHEQRWDAAQEAIDTLRETAWPSRFGDVKGSARNLEQRIVRERSRP